MADTWNTAVTEIQPNSVRVRGYDIAELMGTGANDVQAMIILGVPSSVIVTGEQSAVTLSEPSGGLEFFQLVGDDVIYSNAHIAKVWTLEPTALADARQALVNIRAGKELKDEFEGKTAADMEQEVERLEADLEKLTGRRMELKIVEINDPQRNAVLVAEDVASQLVKRGSFRRAIKRTLDQVMEAGVHGVKIQVSGRLGGAEMSRTEKASRGSIPLSTLQRHIDYGFAEARTAQGTIGVKVWIHHGTYASSEESGDGANAQAGEAPQKPKKAHKR